MPDELLARFRQVALERIEHVEQSWNHLVQGGDASEVSVKLRRDLHTFKGEASVIGFADVGLVCHKLEELVQAADRLGYRVPQDLDLLVMMAIRFMLLLVRKRAGHKLAGIDLAGFVKQVDEVVAEVRTMPVVPAGRPAAPATATPVEVAASGGGDRLSAPARQRLGRAAVLAFLESQAGGGRDDRMREVWQILSTELAALGAVELTPRLRRHARQALDLARDLGKEVAVDVDAPEDLRVAPEIADALDTALLHLLRNAVDHGVEPPAARTAAGKALPARVTIRTDPRAGSDLVELVIEDDGAGIDLAAVAQRALELGVRAADAPAATASELLELLFHPGFTTRRRASAVSGRGIGLDAVRSELQERGGAVTVRSTAGAGTAFTLRAPRALGYVDVSCFRASGPVGLVIAVPATWEVTVAPDAEGAVHPLVALDLAPAAAADAAPFTAVRLRRGRFDLRWAGVGPVRAARADRTGGLGEDQPAEVVEVDGAPALLVRPELIR
ncbi:MAG TPA: ATP-binding protein [Kofleriaceae bacterium]|nr:ATP-binding protein [Kofleriaceae bacterium]